VDLQKAAVAQADAQLENAKINLWRAQQLVRSTAGTQKAVDDAQAAQRPNYKRHKPSLRPHGSISNI
jgi:membrane fusion protein (multidrug efflux system)